MTDPELLQSLVQVREAMDRLSQQFLAKVDALRQRGVDEVQIKRLTEGAQAMRNSSTLYLEWAQFYAQEVSKTDRGESTEEPFLDEGADFGGAHLH
jgi:hypothetical protein